MTRERILHPGLAALLAVTLLGVAAGCSIEESTGPVEKETAWQPEPGFFTPMETPIGTILYGVWGSSASDVYAVGEYGRILHYNGTAWTVQESGTPRTLYGAGGLSASQVYAVGDSGVVLRYNGTSWASDWPAGKERTADHVMSIEGVLVDTTVVIRQALRRIWIAPDETMFIAGHGGRILRKGPADDNWWVSASGATTNLRGIHGVSVDLVMVVGQNGTLRQFNPAAAQHTTQWNPVSHTLAVSDYFYGIFIESANAISIAGASGLFAEWDGVEWLEYDSGTNVGFWGYGGRSENVYAFGGEGVVVKFDGETLTRMNRATVRYLYDIYMPSDNDVFLVGSGGVILRGQP
jgi:photosystem II stability/assembly factor-like uncharacterized protein